MYKILSESAWFCRQCDQNIWCVFGYTIPIAVRLQNVNTKFHGVVWRHYSRKLETLTTASRIYSGQCAPNFIIIDWVMWKI